jgi:serine/threonine-protein kinase
MSPPQPEDDLAAKTLLKVPSSVAVTQVVASARTTTLPHVTWGQAGPSLEQRSLTRYETKNLLGQGGMGEVVKAHDNDIGRNVAVKRLRPELQNADALARFVEEVRTVGQLEHPNIVPIHDAGVDDQGYYFVMKHLEGESLEAIIGKLAQGDPAAHARWPFERRVEVIRKVLEALRYAHAKGVIHRDIKPANILVGPMGEVFVLDWGIARRERSGASSAGPAAAPAPSSSALQTQAGQVMGTPLYMSPEQTRGDVLDARSDLYSLCVVLFEFLTLKHPLEHRKTAVEVMQGVQELPPPYASSARSPYQGIVPMDLTWLIRKGLAKDAALRYQSADELITRLNDRAEGKVPIQCHVTFAKRTGYEAMRLVYKHPLLSPVVVLAALAASVYLMVR